MELDKIIKDEEVNIIEVYNEAKDYFKEKYKEELKKEPKKYKQKQIDYALRCVIDYYRW